MLQEGAVGEVITARAYFGGRVGTGWGSKPWRYDKAITGGGICIDGGSHTIRPLRMWFGEIDEVVAITGHPLAEMEGESLARALFRFSSGMVVGFDALRAGSFHGPGEEFRITGAQGELVIEKGKNGRLVRYTREHPDGEVILDNKNEGRNAAFGYELLDFQRAVLEGKPTETTIEYSMGELRTALAIYRSAESRQWEKVWDSGDQFDAPLLRGVDQRLHGRSTLINELATQFCDTCRKLCRKFVASSQMVYFESAIR